MKTKKTYIAIIVAIFLLTIIFLFFYAVKKENKYLEKILKNQQENIEETEENLPKVGIVSGEVVSVENGYIKIKVNIYGDKEQIIRVNPAEKIVKKSGSYDKNGKFENISEKEIESSEIKSGEHISVVLKDPLKIEDLEKNILESEYIGVTPPTNIKLN